MVACIDAVMGDELVFDRAGFERVRDAVSSTVLDRLFETVGVVATILAKAREADKAIRDATSITLLAPLGRCPRATRRTRAPRIRVARRGSRVCGGSRCTWMGSSTA